MITALSVPDKQFTIEGRHPHGRSLFSQFSRLQRRIIRILVDFF